MVAILKSKGIKRKDDKDIPTRVIRSVEPGEWIK
jgi:hypothetical protein